MQYNQNVLELKKMYLDIILKKEEVLHRVLKRHIGSDYKIENISRVWNPGGGSTLFKVLQKDTFFFLKVKHKSILTESKIEEEQDFSDKSSLQNEFEMMKELENENFVPRILFFDEEEDIQFLAMEYIAGQFVEQLESANLEETLACWDKLYVCVKRLYELGIVHSDLHEHNIRFRNKNMDIVLIDFEESRYLKQDCCFEESLDYCGRNEKSSLGEYVNAFKQSYMVRYNCLLRLNEIFKEKIAAKTIEYIKECNYDSSNGICVAIDHGKSDKTYQSITNNYMHIAGQRADMDRRIPLLRELCKILFRDKYIFVDVGSNNGLFCREVSKSNNDVVKCIGLEGFPKFNILARALAFLEDCKNVEYYDFHCGEDELYFINNDEQCFITICSVWHHIQKKNDFLMQLKKLNIKYIFFEMAIQEECYEGHSWEEEIKSIQKELNFSSYEIIGYSVDYNRPLILMTQSKLSDKEWKVIYRVSKKTLKVKKHRFRYFNGENQ